MYIKQRYQTNIKKTVHGTPFPVTPSFIRVTGKLFQKRKSAAPEN